MLKNIDVPIASILKTKQYVAHCRKDKNMRQNIVPISLKTITRKTVPQYVEQAKSMEVTRVLLVGNGHIYTDSCELRTNPDDVKFAIDSFRENGMEVGFWFSAFGHGSILFGVSPDVGAGKYVSITGIDGNVSQHGHCPLDENFKRDYYEGLKLAASFKPDMILFDDDFRITNRRGYRMGCFCELHRADYFNRIGEVLPLPEVEDRIFHGGKNKYRDAYMDMLGDTLRGFLRGAREVINEVDKTIRLALCTAGETVDYDGTDIIEMSKIGAGENKPFLRIYGAPYHNANIVCAVEHARVLFQWCNGHGIECVSEGDVYPRPRYNPSSASKQLELFNYALLATGMGSGELNYVFDYNQKPDYETGYIERFAKTLPVRKKIEEMFNGKSAVGVYQHREMHKMRNWDFPDNMDSTARILTSDSIKGAGKSLFAQNSIPTSMVPTGYPTAVIGEDAKYVDLSILKDGAVLDATAAKILSARGVDTGLISCERAKFACEYYIAEDDTVPGVDNNALMRIKCSDKAKILSYFTPGDSPASYRYENASGQRFYVLAFDGHFASEKLSYTNNYYRAEHMMSALEWISGKKLPAKTYKNPGLYLYVARDENSTAIMAINSFYDDIAEPRILLDKHYDVVNCINCTARIEGDELVLSELVGFSFAAVELR